MTRLTTIAASLLASVITFPVVADIAVFEVGPQGPVLAINAGSVLLTIALIAAFWKLLKVLGAFHEDYLHIVGNVELLVDDYCDRKHIAREELPHYRTRAASAGGGGE